MRRHAVLAISGAVFLAGAALAEGPADQLPDVDRLPDDTIVYLFRAGWSETTERLASTPAGKALANPRVREFFTQMRFPATRQSPRSDLFAFAFDGLHEELVIAAREASENGQITSRHFAMASPVADRRAHFDGLFTALKARPFMKVAREAGWPIELVRIGDAGKVHFGWDGKRAIVADSSEAASWALAAKAAKPLSKSAAFRTAIDPLFAGQSARPIAMYYYDFRSWWPSLDAAPEARGWSESSWRSLDTISGATFVENGQFRNRHYWKLGSRRTGLFRHTQAARINREWLKRVPADATGLTTGVWDPGGFVPTLAALGMWVFGSGTPAIRGVYEHGEIIKPVAATMGNRYLVYRLPNRYGAGTLFGTLPNVHLVALFEIKSGNEFVGAIDEFVRSMQGLERSIQSSTWDGVRVRTINLYYAALYIAALDDVAIVTAHPQLLKDAIDAYRNPGPSIVETPAFIAAQKSVSPESCFLMFFPPGGFARGVYDEFLPTLLQYLALVYSYSGSGGAANPLNPLCLPRGRELVAGITLPTVLSARDDGQAIVFDGSAPLLSMSYYWPYVHALMNINEKGSPDGLWPIFAWYLFE